MSALQHQRLADESPAVRTSRLDQMSALQHQRLADESPAVRTSRLDQMSALQYQSLANESPDKRAARLARKRQNRNHPEMYVPLLEQPAVKGKMLKFHHIGDANMLHLYGEVSRVEG